MCFDPQSRDKVVVRRFISEYMVDKDFQIPNYPKVNFWFWMPIPKSMSKADKEYAEREELRHVKKPDVDNLIKFYLDVMTGLLLHDDNCVMIGKAMKIYSRNPRTTIFIEEQPRYITQSAIYE